MDVAKYLETGSSKLGLSGKDLRKWCDEMIKEEERLLIAEEERKIAEQSRKLEEMRKQNELLDQEASLERLRIERMGGQVYRTNLHNLIMTVPRLPVYDEKESIDSFLVRFERIAQTHDWEEHTWVINLSTILKGKGLEVYSRLSYDQAADYTCVKETLMETYNLTANTFKEKFRESCPNLVQNMTLFQTRIEGYFDKWVNLAGKNINDAVDVKDLMIQERMFNSCRTSLQIFVKERQPSDSRALGKIIDTYICAHGQSGAFNRQNQLVTKSVARCKSKQNIDTSVKSKGCFVCGKIGHLAKDCRKSTSERTSLVCAYCGKPGHSIDRCLKKKRELSTVLTVTDERETKNTTGHPGGKQKEPCHVQIGYMVPVVRGKINGQDVDILRGSGSSCVVIKRELVEPVDAKAPCSTIQLANGHAMTTPVVEVEIDSLYFKGRVMAVAMKQPLYDVIIGNIPGALCPGINSKEQEEVRRDLHTKSITERSQEVVTRNSKKKEVKSRISCDAQDVGVNTQELIELQINDGFLNKVRALAESGETRRSGNANETRYALDKGVLVRYFKSSKVECGNEICQIIVPKILRNKVMSRGHESILAGHLGTKKTAERIMLSFYWPQIWQDVTRYCRSFDQCQRYAYIGKESRVPMEPLPLIDEPFSLVAIDLTGPILPASERGHRYILTMVDFASRYPDAVALKSSDTVHVAEALVEMFSRVGVPKELLSDRGCQLTSDLMKEISRLLSIKQLVISPYHPQCNGLVEHFNGTLKMMLKKMTTERPRDWDRYIPAAFFAYREATLEALGFSPFELLCGRTPRGPMTILKELWLGKSDNEVKTTYQYVVDLEEWLEQTMNLAKESLKRASKRNKSYFDKRSRNKKN